MRLILCNAFASVETVFCVAPGYRVEILDCHFENSTSRVPIVYANIPTGYIQNTPQVSLGCGQGDW